MLSEMAHLDPKKLAKRTRFYENKTNFVRKLIGPKWKNMSENIFAEIYCPNFYPLKIIVLNVSLFLCFGSIYVLDLKCGEQIFLL